MTELTIAISLGGLLFCAALLSLLVVKTIIRFRARWNGNSGYERDLP